MAPSTRLVGVAAAPGIGIGPAHFLGGRVEVHHRRIQPDEVEIELARFEAALRRSDAELRRIQAQLEEQEQDSQRYQILEAHRLMLTDVHLVEETRRLVREELVSVEWAVRTATDQIQAAFLRIQDPYFRDRRSDIDMVGEQLLRNLVVADATARDRVPPGGVAFAPDVSPADITLLHRLGVAAIFTESGGKTSHASVLARAFGLPFVVAVQGVSHRIAPGTTVVVDGDRGTVVVGPDEATLLAYRARADHAATRDRQLAELREAPAVTLDGVRVHLAANLELIEEVPGAIELGAESIGLFRTEFLYLERKDLPSEEEQYEHAVSVLRALGGRVATFRTLDLGGDKLPPSVQIPAGHNPAMGLRSIRFSLSRPDVFRAQLRALYRAAAEGPLRILFPMISGVAELRAAKEICGGVVRELGAAGIKHNPFVPIGTMIETPSAALIADLLGQECEFLSIGTNDLIQYALAADREDEHVGYLYHPLHPGILRLLRDIANGARRAGRPLAMCGDMAGDPVMTWVLLGLGLRDFSMAPRQIPIIKSIIRATRLEEARQLVDTIFQRDFRTEAQIEALVNDVTCERFPGLVDSDAEHEDAVRRPG
jgi:phosphotransferase system enzyme I (PtsI)